MIKAFRQFLKVNFDSKRAAGAKAYLYSDLVHYGLPTGKIYAYFRSLKPQLKSLSKPKLISLAKSFWAQPSFEEKSLGLEILKFASGQLTSKDIPLIEKMMRQAKGWALLDNLIIPLMPSILTKDPRAYVYLKKWIIDSDFWVRRSALLAQNLFFRKGKGRFKLFFSLAQSQFDESWIDKAYKDPLTRKRARFFIRKAIGWSLREMSLKRPQLVYDFLVKNRKQMSGLSFREGSRKLPDSLKKRL